MFFSFRIITWVSILFINIYAIAPIYIVQTTGDGTGLVQPHNTHANTLANQTSRLPSIEEMNGDFHHHDSRGNDLIRIEKKNAVIRASMYLKPLPAKEIFPFPTCSSTDYLIFYTRNLVINRDFKQREKDGFLSEKAGHSPPVFLL
jgi:hypothetical protein